MEVIEPKKEKPEEPLFSIVVDIFASGNRTIEIRRGTAKVDPTLSYIREVLHWAIDTIGDKLQDLVLKMQLQAIAKTKIVKPGFRPMTVLNKFLGK